MKKRAGAAVMEMCGAVIGAGFASGREVAAFFARYGRWSWLGVAAAAAAAGVICRGVMRSPGDAGMPIRWRETWLGTVWRWMFAGLMIATAGAMLAGAGEIAALMLPVRGARVVGLAATGALASHLSRQGAGMLPGVSRMLVACLIAVVAAGLLLPAGDAALLRAGGGPGSVASGLCYGGFNAALAVPLMARAGASLSPAAQRRSAWGFALVVGALLACGNGVLLRHPVLMDDSLPFVQLLAPLGKAGFFMTATAFYLASLTTLTACLQGLEAIATGRQMAAWAAIAVLAVAGLEHVVSVAYPLLGGVCFIFLAAALVQNQTNA